MSKAWEKKKKKDFSLFSFLTRGIRKLWRHWVLETEKQGKWGNGENISVIQRACKKSA